MLMPMMNIWVVRMSMIYPLMSMHVTVRLGQKRWIVMMLVVLIMTVPVVMLKRLMPVPVFVPFSQM